MDNRRAGSLRLLQQATEHLLACPLCKASLTLQLDCLVCTRCCARYPIHEGIPVLLPPGSLIQENERQFRDDIAATRTGKNTETLLTDISAHHCQPVMRSRAQRFYARFQQVEWILDVGIGWGWHWLGSHSGPAILGLDMSLRSLILARQILENHEKRILLVCADAAQLPLREDTITGIWSVQVFQHFPEQILKAVLEELNRVLRKQFVLEVYNLNPALFLRAIYRLFGRRLRRRDKTLHMELNRWSAEEWALVWRQFRNGRTEISCGYSELFFHPDLRWRPRRYPEKLERVLVAASPWLASLFARQVELRIRSKRDLSPESCEAGLSV